MATVALSIAALPFVAGGCSSEPSGAPVNDSTIVAGTTAAPAASAAPVIAPTTEVAKVTTTAPATTGAPSSSAPSTVPAVDRPRGPAADLSEELAGGKGLFLGSGLTGLDPSYVEHEFVAAGNAVSYRAVGELTSDGRWTFEPDVAADYRTRIAVRRPVDVSTASGVVVVEWLNVSGGVDADPDFTTLADEIIRQGHVWVGVSAQRIGVEGGPVAVKVDTPGSEDIVGKGIKAIDPARYGSLNHPGDAFSYDIYTQVTRALRAGGEPLGGITPTYVVAAGESQSAFALVTYVNGVQPLTSAFDGFFVHSRGGVGLPLVPPGQPADIAGALGSSAPTILRTDTTVPILELQTEGDVSGVLNSLVARQPDTDLFRLWEVAGTAHADAHLVGKNAANMDCGGMPINDGPVHIVGKAALRHLVAWIGGGNPPPEAPRLEVDEATGAMRRDADGIALGGIRTPPVDVPTRVLSSVPGGSTIICLLLGSTSPLSPDRLAELYPSRADFEQRYAAAVDVAIGAGFVLPEDRAALEGYAHPELVGS